MAGVAPWNATLKSLLLLFIDSYRESSTDARALACDHRGKGKVNPGSTRLLKGH